MTTDLDFPVPVERVRSGDSTADCPKCEHARTTENWDLLKVIGRKLGMSFRPRCAVYISDDLSTVACGCKHPFHAS